MLRSMFTAISSLTLHQAFMDVVADNLANVNTSGFKASRATFQDQFAQVMSTGAAPSSNLGGINPTQIGLGMRMGNVTISFTQGTLQGTGRMWDFAIQGDGFFIYNNGAQNLFSRDGSLELDARGDLVNGSTGFRVQGWMPDASGVIDTGLQISSIRIPIDKTMARATTNTMFAGNLDSTSATGSAGAYNVTTGSYDSLGALTSVTMTFTKTSDNNWSWAAVSGASGSGTLAFDAGGSGQFTSGGGSFTVPASGGAPATVVTLDLSQMTQFASANTMAAVSQDGLSPGTLAGFSVVSNTGEIFGTYSNGLEEVLGRIALATFFNPSGLLRIGQNVYRVGMNSGDPEIGVPGSGSRGTVTGGYLEASNVDLAHSFTNMILAQRGFQASSRMISTSDEMLQELVNLKR